MIAVAVDFSFPHLRPQQDVGLSLAPALVASPPLFRCCLFPRVFLSILLPSIKLRRRNSTHPYQLIFISTPSRVHTFLEPTHWHPRPRFLRLSLVALLLLCPSARSPTHTELQYGDTVAPTPQFHGCAEGPLWK